MIKIKNIELFNFISFFGGPHKLEIDGRDLLLVLGDVDHIKSNGAGKTSLVNAIAWCLFGEIPGYGNPADRIINIDNIKKGAYVRINTVDNYQITRYRKYQGKTGLEIINNGSDISLMTTTENQQMINDIFSISYESFIVSIFLSASEKSFIDLSPLKRFHVISDLLDINRLNKLESRIKNKLSKDMKIIDEYKTIISNIETQIQILQKEIEIHKSSFEEYQHELHQNKENINNKKKEINNKLINIDIENINNTLKEWEEYDESIQQLNTIKRQIEVANNELKNLEDKLQNHPLKNEINLIKSQLSELNTKKLSIQYNIEKSNIKAIQKNLKLWEEYNKKLEEISSLKEEIKDIELNISTLEYNMESKIDLDELKKDHELYGQNENNKTEKNTILGRLKSLRSQQLNLENEKKEFEKLDNICPLCHQSINEEYKNNIITNFNNKISELSKSLKIEYNKYNKLIVEDIQPPKMTIEEAIEYNKKIDNLSQKIEKLKQIKENKNEKLELVIPSKPKIEYDVLLDMQFRYNSLVEKLQEIDQTINTLNEKLEKRTKEYKEDIDKIKNEICDINRIIDSKQQYIDKIKLSKPNKDRQILIEIKTQYKSLKMNLERLNQEYELLQEQFSIRNNKYQESIENLHHKIEELVEELKSNQLKFDEMKSICDHRKILYNIFHDKDKLKMYIINMFLDTFNKRLNDYLGAFGWDINLTFDEKLNLSSSRLFSSGEKRRINLAISFALLYAKFLLYGSYSNFMILDEIDNGLDSEGIEKLISILEDLLNQNFVSSIIILTHKSDLKDYIDNRIIISKTNQRSKIIQN